MTAVATRRAAAAWRAGYAPWRARRHLASAAAQGRAGRRRRTGLRRRRCIIARASSRGRRLPSPSPASASPSRRRPPVSSGGTPVASAAARSLRGVPQCAARLDGEQYRCGAGAASSCAHHGQPKPAARHPGPRRLITVAARTGPPSLNRPSAVGSGARPAAAPAGPGVIEVGRAMAAVHSQQILVAVGGDAGVELAELVAEPLADERTGTTPEPISLLTAITCRRVCRHACSTSFGPVRQHPGGAVGVVPGPAVVHHPGQPGGQAVHQNGGRARCGQHVRQRQRLHRPPVRRAALLVLGHPCVPLRIARARRRARRDIVHRAVSRPACASAVADFPDRAPPSTSTRRPDPPAGEEASAAWPATVAAPGAGAGSVE